MDNLGITKDMVLLNNIVPLEANKLLVKPQNYCLQQKYREVNETFLKSNHPAVARTKPRLSSPFPIANLAFGSPSQVGLSNFLDPYNQNTNSRQFRHEADAQEVVTSFNEYIIPIPDPKPEEDFTDVPSESPERYRDADSPERCWSVNSRAANTELMHQLNRFKQLQLMLILIPNKCFIILVGVILIFF